MSAKAIFLNDTSGTSNPGCQGTVACLIESLAMNNIDIVSRLPVGYGYREFSHCDVPRPHPSLSARVINRASRSIQFVKPLLGRSTANCVSPVFCPDGWMNAIDSFARRLAPIWTQADHLVVNGEGTIHHDSIGARNLIGLCVVGKKLGMHVSILNCSIYELSETLLTALRETVDQIVVREPMSFRYLAEQNVHATLSADCLFLAASKLDQFADQRLPRIARQMVQRERKIALYTPGVLSGSGQVTESIVTADIQRLISDGYDVIYYVVEAEDEHLAPTADSAGATIMPLGSIQWTEVSSFLKSVSLVVSGRYHINIFAAICGAPFLAMETNTPKMDGLLQLLKQSDHGTVRRLDDTGTSTSLASNSDSIEASALRPTHFRVSELVDTARANCSWFQPDQRSES